jgi:hypothetical protein
MKLFAVSLAVLALFVPAIAQDQGAITERNVLTQPTVPAPQNGDIIIRVGRATRVYFKHPFKTVRLGDEYSAKAIPESDHIIAFTGLAPGHSSLTVEGNDGREIRFGVVTVVSEPHVVKIYRPEKVNPVSGELRQDSVEASGFVSIRCNEVGCGDAPR